MNVQIQKVIESTLSLPSLPAIATQIVQMAKNPNINMLTVAEMLAKDPAMATKVLRIVNSTMYVKPRQVENLHQAIVIMGLNQTMSMALSFSLISSMKKLQGTGIDYQHYWRRALLAATTARVLGEYVGEESLEELFLAALLQDIGMLALDRSEPTFYTELGDTQFHQKELLEYEKERMGVDHAHLGAELLQKWNLAERTCNAVKYSHDPKKVNETNINSRFVRCVALSGLVADLFVNKESQRSFLQMGHFAHSYLGFDHKNFQQVLEKVAALIPEIEVLFDTNFVSDGDADTVLDQAREILLNQNIDALREVDRLKREAKQMDAAARVHKESGYRDAITGTFNRQYLEDYLAKVFLISKQTGKPVSIAFVTLKELANINHAHGHAAGDKLLKFASKLISDSLLQTAVVARYGGGEFVVVLPGADEKAAADSCDQILKSFQMHKHNLSSGEELILSVAIGIATEGSAELYQSKQDFFAAAEASLYHIGAEVKKE